MTQPNNEQNKLMRARFEHMGAQQVRILLQNGGLNGNYDPLALEWLAEKDKEAAALAAASQADMASAASRAAVAAERAATAAEAQAGTAKQALVTAIAATVIAAIALVVSIIGFFHFFGR